jgi:hypothetical protein
VLWCSLWAVTGSGCASVDVASPRCRAPLKVQRSVRNASWRGGRGHEGRHEAECCFSRRLVGLSDYFVDARCPMAGRPRGGFELRDGRLG